MFSNKYMFLLGTHIVSGRRRHNSIGESLHLGWEKHGISNKIEICMDKKSKAITMENEIQTHFLAQNHSFDLGNEVAEEEERRIVQRL